MDSLKQVTDSVSSDLTGDQKSAYCSWMRESHIDWIIQGPVCAVLIINLIFLVRIMWVSDIKILFYSSSIIIIFRPFVPFQVLITKLRSANTAETRTHRKASKALLVLIPLLGLTYLVVIAGKKSIKYIKNKLLIKYLFKDLMRALRVMFLLYCEPFFSVFKDFLYQCCTASLTQRYVRLSSIALTALGILAI